MIKLKQLLKEGFVPLSDEQRKAIENIIGARIIESSIKEDIIWTAIDRRDISIKVLKKLCEYLKSNFEATTITRDATSKGLVIYFPLS